MSYIYFIVLTGILLGAGLVAAGDYNEVVNIFEETKGLFLEEGGILNNLLAVVVIIISAFVTVGYKIGLIFGSELGYNLSFILILMLIFARPIFWLFAILYVLITEKKRKNEKRY